MARATAVGTTPVPVGAGGRAYVLVRLRPGGEVSAFPARCPHRLVPLTAATTVDGTLQCPYHGWRFDGDGRCVDVPSLGPAGSPPPRADLTPPWAVEERHGWVWLAPERTAVALPPRPVSPPEPEPVPAPADLGGPLLDNLHPGLRHAWHPVALSRELRPGGWLMVRLLGRTWVLRRTAGSVAVEPPAGGVRERGGVVELAPAEPAGSADAPLDLPEVGDRRFVGDWLAPERAAVPAGPLLDTFLDAAHVPVVHGVGRLTADPEVPAVDVVEEPGGFTAVQDLDASPHPPPAGPSRVATSVYRVPFRVRLRVDCPRTGAVRTLVHLLQPEDADSTRVYTRVLLSAGPGRPLPGPDALAAAVGDVRGALAEDLELHAQLGLPGLPLRPREELHVPADACGVALRRALADLVAGRG
ncbi:Rieske 2Fe-2S domain-containing protein [Trujillonella endophytica]|uniref:Rieske 2Fe-2S domain-containing protein n=1 Tax=Trujillonella endophytica TaxID=673521 RepID=UPI001FCD4654|nr:Rieske 2Fe-2S domain-containing protein [Trujillella endophytica]